MFLGPSFGPDVSVEAIALVSLRDLTKWFIAQDPTEVVLTPYTKVENDNGSEEFVAGSPKDPQIVKIIFPSGQSDGISPSIDGQNRKYDFVLVAEYNADIEIYDQWMDDRGNEWVVTGLTPFNGYEVKAMCKSYGKNPSEG